MVRVTGRGMGRVWKVREAMMGARGAIGRVAGVLVAAVFAGGCTGGPEAGAPEPARSAVEGLQGRICRYVSAHDAVPAFRDLARIGTGGNISLWADDLTDADSVELSIRYGDDGRLEWVEAIEATVDTHRVAALERLVLGTLEGYGQTDWGVRLLVVGGDVVSVEPSVICDAERVGGSSIWSSSPNVQRALVEFFRVRGSRFPVRVTLDHQGRVLDVELIRSAYRRWVDQYIVDFVRNSMFDPKLHDGIGVASVVEIQLRLGRR